MQAASSAASPRIVESEEWRVESILIDTSSLTGTMAEPFGRGWSLKQAHPYLYSFVSIDGSPLSVLGSFFLEFSARQGGGRAGHYPLITIHCR